MGDIVGAVALDIDPATGGARELPCFPRPQTGEAGFSLSPTRGSQGVFEILVEKSCPSRSQVLTLTHKFT